MIRFNVGDSFISKKQHPCGSSSFRILRVGSDVRIICLGCQRDMTLGREKVEKMIKKVCIASDAEDR